MLAGINATEDPTRFPTIGSTVHPDVAEFGVNQRIRKIKRS
jgi:hypothetical protein